MGKDTIYNLWNDVEEKFLPKKYAGNRRLYDRKVNLYFNFLNFRCLFISKICSQLLANLVIFI